MKKNRTLPRWWQVLKEGGLPDSDYQRYLVNPKILSAILSVNEPEGGDQRKYCVRLLDVIMDSFRAIPVDRRRDIDVQMFNRVMEASKRLGRVLIAEFVDSGKVAKVDNAVSVPVVKMARGRPKKLESQRVVPFTVSLSVDHVQMLKRKSEALRRPASDFVRQALDMYFSCEENV
jgi:hypothetical protein